jgi:hypothetical protein
MKQHDFIVGASADIHVVFVTFFLPHSQITRASSYHVFNQDEILFLLCYWRSHLPTELDTTPIAGTGIYGSRFILRQSRQRVEVFVYVCKSQSFDYIPAVLIKAEDNTSSHQIRNLVNSIWNKEDLPK